MRLSKLRIVIITGLSGSGKSTAVKALEDEGFFCLDNLPVALFATFVELVDKSTERIRDVALVSDIRGRDFQKGPENMVQELRTQGHTVEVLFFDATDEVLIRRFSETRRRHPALEGGSVPDGIRFEREQLMPLRRIATAIIDTSELNVHQLKEQVVAWSRGEGAPRGLTIQIFSFGYRYGVPLESDLVLDVRFLANPHFVPELKPLTGLDPKVRSYVVEHPLTATFMAKLQDMIDFLLPAYEREGKTYLTISIGCTGGRHRSVSIAEELAAYLRGRRGALTVVHRDIEKG